MTETIQVGTQAPDFNLTTYEPRSGDFGEVSLEELKSSGKWTILFFYPETEFGGDFETAIRHGATIVRVGTAVFGERAPPG